jgi:hypothetical protein
MAAEAVRRRRRLSLRWRIVLVATAVVALALVVGSAAFVGVLRESLIAGVQLTAERDAAELVGRVETSGASAVDVDVDDDDDQVVQLVSADELGAEDERQRRRGPDRCAISAAQRCAGDRRRRCREYAEPVDHVYPVR